MGNLEDLVQHRDMLLLAEAVAWLHDMGKCDERHLKKSASDYDKSKPIEYHYKTTHSGRVGKLDLNLLGESVPLKNLIEQGMPGTFQKTNVPWLIRTLGLCHGVAHTEKAETYYLAKQKTADTRLSTPFGYEFAPITGLQTQLDALDFNAIAHRSDFMREVKDAFSKTVGDTRRPLNDVSLWIWSNTVAVFYKAALAFAILSQPTDPSTIDLFTLHWRLLSVRFNGLQFLESVARISDLLARQKLIDDSFRKVRLLLEETYPLGTGVYSDENGIVFLVPDIDTLLELQDQHGTTLYQLILDAFKSGTIDEKKQLQLGEEVVPHVVLGPTWPSDPVPWYPREKLKPPPILPIAEQLPEIPANRADPSSISRWWQNDSRDICSVCHLRPQGWRASAHPMHHEYQAKGKTCPPALRCQLCKALERKVCSICEQRRENRSQRWADEERNTTIWLDEVADTNGQLALIVGKFGLEPWLDGDVLFYPRGLGEAGEAPSPDRMIETGTPARLLRVWETTQAFWQAITADFKARIGLVNTRLHLYGEFRSVSKDGIDALAVSHTYDLKISSSNLSIVCIAPGEYLTVDNLRRIALLLGAQKAVYEDETKAANYLQDYLQGTSWEVEEPTGYGSPNKPRGRLHITHVTAEHIPYIPAVSLFDEPRIFMALVPAGKTLNVAQAIRDRYREEMSKVRNRLPLTLGIVFAGSRTPLPAILDAGRRMLKPSVGYEEWTVRKVDLLSIKDSWPTEVKLLLEKNAQTLPITVRTVMGDETISDVWYPYWRVEKDSNGHSPSGRTRQYLDAKGNIWVQIHDLQEGDMVSFMPSRFDFEFLDTAARRFEISYDENGGRRGRSHPARPYYLEQLDEFEMLWNILFEGLETTQIDNLVGLIEEKRMEWLADHNDEVFKQTVHDALNNANWRPHKRPKPASETFEQLYRAAVSGQLADVVEVYIRILKRQTEVDKSPTEIGKTGVNV
jgi:hypothetical protein